MKKEAIYYPTIDVPDDKWFSKVLLYWDKVKSIAPREYQKNRSKLGDYTNGLIEQDLVDLITPGGYVYNLSNFTENFLKYVDYSNYSKKFDIENTGTFQVHTAKLGGLGEKLSERGLAKKQSERWYNVEVNTANMFMAYLATCIGGLPDIEATPITNEYQYLNPLEFSDIRKSDLSIDSARIRKELLEEILPTPSSCVDPREIADFKDDYGWELKRFRTKIESFLTELKSIEDPSSRSERKNRFLEEKETEINYLSEKMKSNGWDVWVGPILGVSSAAASATGSLLSDPFTLGGLLTAVGATLGGVKIVSDGLSRSQLENISENKPMSYAIFVEREFV